MTLRQDRRRALGGLVATALSAALPGVARAQGAWPSRPVTLVCPWGAGGGTGATARIVAAILEKNLKQPFNVVNRTGGSGVVGHSAIATAACGSVPKSISQTGKVVSRSLPQCKVI